MMNLILFDPLRLSESRSGEPLPGVLLAVVAAVPATFGVLLPPVAPSELYRGDRAPQVLDRR